MLSKKSCILKLDHELIVIGHCCQCLFASLFPLYINRDAFKMRFETIMELNGKCHESKWHFAPIAIMQFTTRTHSYRSTFSVHRNSIFSETPLLHSHIIPYKFLAFVISFIFVYFSLFFFLFWLMLQLLSAVAVSLHAKIGKMWCKTTMIRKLTEKVATFNCLVGNQ